MNETFQASKELLDPRSQMLGNAALLEAEERVAFLSSRKIAAAGEQEDSYLAAKGFDDLFYMHRVLQYLCMKGHAPREKIERVLKKHLSTTLTDSQKKSKIGNLLSVSMGKQRGWIKNDGGRGHSSWTLTEKGILECKRENAECRRKCPHATEGPASPRRGVKSH